MVYFKEHYNFPRFQGVQHIAGGPTLSSCVCGGGESKC